MREMQQQPSWSYVCEHFGLDTSFQYSDAQRAEYYRLLDREPTEQDAAGENREMPETPVLPQTLSDGRIVGMVEKIAYTRGGAGNQWTTISGKKYATWWDIRKKDWKEGDVVAFKSSNAPLWHGQPEVPQASNIVKLDLALLAKRADNEADNDMATIRISRREYNALVTSLRLLERAMEKGEVVPNDGNLGDILTCSGDHQGLSTDEVCTLCDNLLDGKNVSWDAEIDAKASTTSSPTMSM